MKYTPSFKQKVRTLFPNDSRLSNLLESGSELVGRILDDSAPSSISNDTVLKATSLQELQDLAKNNKAKVDLYSEFWKQPKS